jgi:hypothetical protein
MMIVLHITHTVNNFDVWKASFDTFEEFRQKSGVRRYRVTRPVNNPDFVAIDLEFDSLNQAEALLTEVQKVWERVNGTLIRDPQWQFSEAVQTTEFKR